MKITNSKLKSSKRDKRVLIILGVFLFIVVLGFVGNHYYKIISEKRRLSEKQEMIIAEQIRLKNEKDNQVLTWEQEKQKRIKQYAKMRKDPLRINKNWDDNLKIVDGNIFYRDKNSKETQITFKNLDFNPIWSPDKQKIAFLRQPTNDAIVECSGESYGFGGNSWHEIWLYDLITQEEILLTSAEDTCYGYIEKLIFSLDEKRIYFKHSKWVTSSAIEVVDIKTKEVNFITGGNTLEVIQEGEYKGNLLVSKHKYHPAPNYGAYSASCIISPEGEEIKILD